MITFKNTWKHMASSHNLWIRVFTLLRIWALNSSLSWQVPVADPGFARNANSLGGYTNLESIISQNICRKLKWKILDREGGPYVIGTRWIRQWLYLIAIINYLHHCIVSVCLSVLGKMTMCQPEPLPYLHCSLPPSDLCKLVHLWIPQLLASERLSFD